MRKTIVSLSVLCVCIWPLNSFAITNPTMPSWEQDRLDAIMKSSSKDSQNEILGTETDAKKCGVSSLARMIFEAEYMDTYQQQTIKEFAKTITTVADKNGIKTCQFSIPYDNSLGTNFVIRYTIGPDYNYNFVVKDKTEASKILWAMAPWLTKNKQIDFLFEHGAEDILLKFDDPKTKWKYNESSLCRYIYMGNAVMVQKLLDNGANVNNFCYSRLSPNTISQSYVANPISLAVKRDSVRMVKLLLENGAIVEPNGYLEQEGTQDVLQTNPLVESVKNYEILSLLLNQKNVNVNQYVIIGKTRLSPLFGAITQGDLKVIDLLISSGIDFDKVYFDETNKINAVWSVVLEAESVKGKQKDFYAKKYQDMLEKFIKAGADYNSNLHGHTPLSYAKKFIPELADTLKKYNAKEDIEILEHDWCASDYGSKRICGKVRNNTDEEKNVVISFNFYDKDGYRIGNDSTYLSKLEPGSVWKFDNVIPKDETVSYKLIDVQTSLF